MSRIIFLSTALVFFFCAVNAQEKSITKKLWEDAEYYYSIHDYPKAAENYEKIYAQGIHSAELFWKLGFSYQHINAEKAIIYYEQCVKIDARYSRYIFFNLGRCYESLEKFNTAIMNYQKFIGASKNDTTDVSLARQAIAQCNEQKQNTTNTNENFIEIVNAEALNSEFNDEHAIILEVHSVMSGEEKKTIYFTSNRAGSMGNRLASDGKNFQDVWICEMNGEEFGAPYRADTFFNTDSHDALQYIGRNSAILYRYSPENNGNLYILTRGKENRNVPQNLGDTINTEYWESSASLSPDGNTLYFCSDRPGGFGGKDIYMSTRDSDGSWLKAESMGAEINTSEDEFSPFMSLDGTLYFSSKGYEGFGGYDIFKTKFENGKWSPPENLDTPINSTGDDCFYITTPEGKTVYLTSDREGTLGGYDIWIVKLP